jgi:hypothetical protein
LFPDFYEPETTPIMKIEFLEANFLSKKQNTRLREVFCIIIICYLSNFSLKIIMAGMTLGADGGVGNTFNFMASAIRKILDSKDKGDIFEARLCQYRTQQTCKVMNKYGKKFTHDILHVIKGQFALSKS